MGGGIKNTALSKEKKDAFSFAIMLMVKYRKKKKKARQGEPPRKFEAEQLAVENIRARKNGTSPPPLKDNSCASRKSVNFANSVSGYKLSSQVHFGWFSVKE